MRRLKVVAELAKTVPLIGFCGAWTVATYMVEGVGKDQPRRGPPS
jgi:uroporphyrinogen-III decarboxylase